MISVLVALHILPHVPRSRRAKWLRQALVGLSTDRIPPVVEAVRNGSGSENCQLESVTTLLHGAAAQEPSFDFADAAAQEIQLVHQRRSPQDLRPFAGRGCKFCKTACDYGQVFAVAISEKEAELWPLVADGKAMTAPKLTGLATSLVQATLAPGARLAFSPDMMADLGFCLAASLAGAGVKEKHLAGIQAVQEGLDKLRKGSRQEASGPRRSSVNLFGLAAYSHLGGAHHASSIEDRTGS